MPACAVSPASSHTRTSRRSRSSRPSTSSIQTATRATTIRYALAHSRATCGVLRARLPWILAKAWSCEVEKKVRLSVYLDPDLMRGLADFADRREQSRRSEEHTSELQSLMR